MPELQNETACDKKGEDKSRVLCTFSQRNPRSRGTGVVWINRTFVKSAGNYGMLGPYLLLAVSQGLR